MAALPFMTLSAFWMGSEQDGKKLYIEKWRKRKIGSPRDSYEETNVGGDRRNPFMDYYAVKAMKVMKKYGYTRCNCEVCAKSTPPQHH